MEHTIAFLNTIKAEQCARSETRTIVLKMRDRELTFAGVELLQNRSMPNFYFHVTTAYEIMRHHGVELGERNLMGND